MGPGARLSVVLTAIIVDNGRMLNLTADILQGRYVRLEPVTVDHRDELKAAIDCDPDSWEIMSVRSRSEGANRPVASSASKRRWPCRRWR